MRRFEQAESDVNAIYIFKRIIWLLMDNKNFVLCWNRVEQRQNRTEYK